jgi:hypothetical protein
MRGDTEEGRKERGKAKDQKKAEMEIRVRKWEMPLVVNLAQTDSKSKS